MFKRADAKKIRAARHRRVRRIVSGTPERPRLAVYRSLTHIYGQLIDDVAGATLVAASDLEPALRSTISGTKTERARKVGAELAQRALAKGITDVVFDRGGFLYHGRVRSLADGARDGGLRF
ncbi:MAG: 50S ribosomal protein L18 [Chloroflexota bacterium]